MFTGIMEIFALIAHLVSTLACKEIHDGHDPVALEHDGFASKEIDAPQAVLCVSDEREPGGSLMSEASFTDGSGLKVADRPVCQGGQRLSRLVGDL